jgi:hypothetical protein
MRMIVTVRQARVYGKVLKEGDEFECPDKEARLWGVLARAKPADEISEPERRRRGRPPGSYSRRDMRAED